MSLSVGPGSKEGGAICALRPPSAYDALASIYDLWQDTHGSFARLALEKLEDTWARFPYASEIRSFLDIGCGTGTLLVELAARHPSWSLCGLDACSSMLRMARSKPGAGDIAWIHGPMTRGPASGTFDAAGSFFDAVNHLPDEIALGEAFRAAAAALNPRGLFVFDVSNAKGLRAWWNGTRVFDGPGWRLEIEASFDPGSDVARGHVVVTRDGERTEGAVEERCFGDTAIREALRGAGLDVLRAEPWSPFALDEPGKTWWVARRV